MKLNVVDKWVDENLGPIAKKYGRAKVAFAKEVAKYWLILFLVLAVLALFGHLGTAVFYLIVAFLGYYSYLFCGRLLDDPDLK